MGNTGEEVERWAVHLMFVFESKHIGFCTVLSKIFGLRRLKKAYFPGKSEIQARNRNWDVGQERGTWGVESRPQTIRPSPAIASIEPSAFLNPFRREAE